MSAPPPTPELKPVPISELTISHLQNAIVMSVSPQMQEQFSSYLAAQHEIQSCTMQHKNKPRGAFIVLEGLDRAGKTTQCAMLVNALNRQGTSNEDSPPRIAVNLRFPDRTTAIGTMIDAYLKQTKEIDDRAIHLLFSANRWEAAHTIRTLLAEGTHVICDRYAYSGIAFSRSKLADPPVDGQDPHLLSMEWCCQPDRGLPAPDLVCFLDLSAESAAARGQFGAERYERKDIQLRVRAVFDELRAQSVVSSSSSAPFGAGVPWKTIDCNQVMDAVHADLLAATNAAIARVTAAHTPLQSL
jgi:dTMP kinase